MNTPLRVAAWQCKPGPLDVQGNLVRLKRAATQAAEAGADVLVTPEMFLTGYDIGIEETNRFAEPAAGPLGDAVAAISALTGVAVLYGYPELSNGKIYNAARLVDGDHVLGEHRKIQLFGDLDRDRFAPAETVSGVADLRGHPVAIRICYDVEFPEVVRLAALAGAETILVPTANMIGYEAVSTVLVPARAYENGIHVAYANYTGAEGDLVYAGASSICSPDGTKLALAGREEALVVRDLSMTSHSTYLTDLRDDLSGR